MSYKRNSDEATGKEISVYSEKASEVERIVMRNPPKLGVRTLCRLMDDCLPEKIDDERDMQELIDKLWPALCCEFEIDA
tara:strand:+ start:18751 stop:18987 length:237 start_codon:yes stop_codon:yes gene_type:complete